MLHIILLYDDRMKQIFFILFIFFSQHSLGDTEIPPFQSIPEKSIRYELNAPPPFQNTEIKFSLEGAINNRIVLITITTENEVFRIDAEQLKIDFSPNLNEIHFYHDRMRNQEASIESIWFTIWHGAPEKTECGIDMYEYIQKAKKITIKQGSMPMIKNDSAYKSACERYTESEKLHQGG